MIKFSLVIPCFNEEKNLPFLLKRSLGLSKISGLEVIFVDNGSTDKSLQVLKNLIHKHHEYSHCRFVHVEKNQGYGFGILSGLRAAKGQILGWTHADMQTDPCDFEKGIGFFEEYGQDIFVKGRRYGRPFSDVFFTVGMSVFETFLLRTPLWDINAQPTLFSKDFFDSWKEPPYDFSLDLFAYFMAYRSKLKIHRFPVLFSRRMHGVSRWNVDWRAKKKFIERTIQFSFQLKNSLKKK